MNKFGRDWNPAGGWTPSRWDRFLDWADKHAFALFVAACIAAILGFASLITMTHNSQCEAALRIAETHRDSTAVRIACELAR